MTSKGDDLVKKWRLLQEKVKRYEKLSKSTTRTAKQLNYQKEWVQAVDDLTKLEKKIMAQAKKEIQNNEKKIDKKKKEVQKDLKHVYCGAQKPSKGKRVGTESECRQKEQIRRYGKKQIADMTGGNINKVLVNEILNNAVKKRSTMKKGGNLPASLIKKFIVASHEEGLKNVGDYQIDRELSHEWVRVYHNDKKKHCVIVHRGSADKYDAWIDLQLLFQHKNNKRFKISQKVQKEAERKYKGYFITTLGSSLGGYLAEEFGKSGNEVITVSKPTTPYDVLTGKKKGEDQYDIRTTKDPIAILQNFQKGPNDIVIKSKTWDPYANHFGDLVVGDILPEDKLIGKEMSGQGFSDFLSKMRLNQLKELLKLMRNMKRGRARQYPVTRKKKKELLDMIVLLSDDMRGGKLTKKKKESLQKALPLLVPNNMAVPVINYLIGH